MATAMDPGKMAELRDVIKYDSGGRGFKRAAYFLLVWAGLLAVIGSLFIWDMFNQ